MININLACQGFQNKLATAGVLPASRLDYMAPVTLVIAFTSDLNKQAR